MWYDISCRDRILTWRNWRLRLNEVSWQECTEEVAKQWNLVPIVNHYLIPDAIEDWPTPWQLINDNLYCDLAKALGIFYTLALTNHPESESITLDILRNDDDWLNLCQINHGLSTLNWSPGQVVNKPMLRNSQLVFSYTKVDLSSKLH